MDKIDFTLTKWCTTCKTSTPLHHHTELYTLGENSRFSIHVEPDELFPCPSCGNPVYILIQAQPWKAANHLDTAIGRHLYEQEHNGDTSQ